MPAMPPKSAVPILRTLRRVTVVMHSSLVMRFGRSDAGLEPFSVYRASVVQRMHTFSRVQHVASRIIYWCDIVLNRCGDAIGGLYCIGAPQPAHEPHRPTGPSHAAMGLPSPSEFSPSYLKPRTQYRRPIPVA